MVASGWRALAIPAVTGSTSTPVGSMANRSGTVARKVPLPTPGSRTLPPLNPLASTARHTAEATSKLV
jgi:hypothetical protein